MTVTYIGELSIGDTIPGAVAVGVAGAAGINLAIPDIQARIAALLAFAPLPVDFAAQLALVNSMLASVQSAISLGLTPPTIAAQIAAVVALIAELSATLASIDLQLDIILDFQALLSAAGIFAYHYNGAVNALGGEMTTALAAGVGGGAPTDPCDALILLTSTGATWTAMGSIFKVAP